MSVTPLLPHMNLIQKAFSLKSHNLVKHGLVRLYVLKAFQGACSKLLELCMLPSSEIQHQKMAKCITTAMKIIHFTIMTVESLFSIQIGQPVNYIYVVEGTHVYTGRPKISHTLINTLQNVT
jgi:hypothetical protein